jgi:hypothetical protein
VLVTFNEQIIPGTFTASDIRIISPTGSTVPLDSTAPVTDAGDHKTFLLQFAAPLSFGGTYDLEIGPEILDLASNRMDQAGTGIQVNGYRGSFQIVQPWVAASLPLLEGFEAGSVEALGSYWSFVHTVGTISATTNNPHTGTYGLQMDAPYIGMWDVLGLYYQEATLHVNLAG